MARKATRKRAPSTNASQDVSEQEGGGQEGHGFASGNEGSISKTEAIRRALAEGYESPEAGTDYILKTFGLEIGRQHFSSTKSQLKSKEGKKKPGRKPRAVVEGYLAPPSSGGPELLDAIEAMKPLVANLGPDQVKRIVDLLA